MDPNDLASPTHPLSPLNPISPLWIGRDDNSGPPVDQKPMTRADALWFVGIVAGAILIAGFISWLGRRL